MTTINFPNSSKYSGNRPYADVVLQSGSGNNPTHKCLVDTGADYLQLPSSAATSVGLGHLLASAVATNVKIAGGGSVVMQLAHSVSVIIEGYPVTVSVLFDPSNSGPVLLGRQALLAAVEAGFNTKEWLWT